MFKKSITLAAIVAMVGAPTVVASAAETKTPPRLSLMQGEVSFWRPGADNWAAARVNTALAEGDALYTGNGAHLEVQVGPRAFVRAGENTEIGLEDQQADFLQLKVTGGHAAVDVRQLTSGQTIELDTPNAAFTIDRAGYYRLDVSDDSTTFVTRRGGTAAATPSGGTLAAVATGQEAIIQGTDTPQVATYQAPDLDAWDHWNYERGDSAVADDSGGAVPASMYGGDQLGQYGTWRDTQSYGHVWVPNDVDPTWAPYSTGQWMWDPYYGWTWVDDAPWGWAPYHYGRWVHFDSYWGWAPGPIYGPSVYAPALVAFFGFPGFHVGIGFGTPIGWAALGWGEPLLPWWGSAGFIGRPCWNGWFGPRIVNNVFVNNTTIVNVNNINFTNARVPHALVAVGRDHFGNGAVERARIADILHSADPQHLQPLHGALPINAGPHSLVAGAGHGLRPPENVMSRRVVATHAPHTPMLRDPAAARLASAVNPQPRLAPAAQRQTVRGVPNGRVPTSASTRFAPPPPPHSGAAARASLSSRGALTHSGQAPNPGSVPNRSVASRGPASQMKSRWSPPPPPSGRTSARGGYAFASNPPVGLSTLTRGAQPVQPRLPQRSASVPPPPPASRSFAPPRMQAPSGARQRAPMPPAIAAPHVMQPRVEPPQMSAPRMSPPQLSQQRVQPPQIASFRGVPARMGAAQMSAPRFQASRAPAFRPNAPSAPARQASAGRAQAPARGSERR